MEVEVEVVVVGAALRKAPLLPSSSPRRALRFRYLPPSSAKNNAQLATFLLLFSLFFAARCRLETNCSAAPPQTNCVSSHHTLPLAVSGHEHGAVCISDVTSGQCININLKVRYLK